MSTKRRQSPAKRADRDDALPIRFEATVEALGDRTILRLPDAASKALPSRGQVAVRGALDAHPFETVLEPDGEFGHWLSVEASLRRAAGVEPGQRVEVAVALAGEWPEPSVPPDLAEALSDASREIRELWGAITPMARWEWVRWVNATKNPETRRRRVEVSISKMRSGKRRPCCFNLASCTDPDLAKSGKLVRRQPAAD
ncbi:MAG: DUF1905 domain-containing protein [Myxococcales bacterium]|nr:DUF1905 domain-containing protein [Myxococcales bacterium]